MCGVRVVLFIFGVGGDGRVVKVGKCEAVRRFKAYRSKDKAVSLRPNDCMILMAQTVCDDCGNVENGDRVDSRSPAMVIRIVAGGYLPLPGTWSSA